MASALAFGAIFSSKRLVDGYYAYFAPDLAGLLGTYRIIFRNSNPNDCADMGGKVWNFSVFMRAVGFAKIGIILVG